MQKLFKMSQVSWNTIGQSAFKRIPDEFVWIEFWSISWETITVQTGMLTDKFTDRGSFMRGAAVPEQYHVTTEVFEQMAEKPCNFGRFDVLVRMKPSIKRDAFPFWGDTESRDGRDFFPSIRTAQDWSLSSWCPCSDNVRNQEKSTFIEEHQMSSKFLGFFLYTATWCFSNMQSPSRPVPVLVSPVSGNSSPAPLGISTDDWDDRKCQNGLLSLLSHGAESKGRSYIRNSSLLSGETVSTSAVEDDSIWVASQALVSNLMLLSLSSDTRSTSEIPNLQSSLFSGTLPADFSFSSATRWHAGVAFPVALGFRRVSCPIVYNILNVFSITYA